MQAQDGAEPRHPENRREQAAHEAVAEGHRLGRLEREMAFRGDLRGGSAIVRLGWRCWRAVALLVPAIIVPRPRAGETVIAASSRRKKPIASSGPLHHPVVMQ